MNGYILKQILVTVLNLNNNNFFSEGVDINRGGGGGGGGGCRNYPLEFDLKLESLLHSTDLRGEVPLEAE